MHPERLVNLVKRLTAYEQFKIDEDLPYLYSTYRGINHKYYQKWVGFSKLEQQAPQEEVDNDVIDFYLSYFYYALKLDILEDDQLQYLILNFAVQNGKKKAISKIQKALDLEITGNASIKLMEVINFFPRLKVANKLILEFLEFYDFTNNLQSAKWLLSFYRSYK